MERWETRWCRERESPIEGTRYSSVHVDKSTTLPCGVRLTMPPPQDPVPTMVSNDSMSYITHTYIPKLFNMRRKGVIEEGVHFGSKLFQDKQLELARVQSSHRFQVWAYQ